MNEKIDNIYVYIWEEFSTIYVGRSKNPKKRHYQHKTRECDKTYKFSSEHHVEHPPMIIIESDLTVEEGAKREKYWINYYRNQGHYNLLNKTAGGQLGMPSKYTNEERKQHQKEYYQKNKERILEYRKKYYETHSEEIKEKLYWKKYYDKHFEENKIKAKEYREKHKEEIKSKKKEYYENNKEKILKKVKSYHDLNKEEMKKKAKEYREKNRDLLRIKAKEYREKHKEEIKSKKKEYYKLHRKRNNN